MTTIRSPRLATPQRGARFLADALLLGLLLILSLRLTITESLESVPAPIAALLHMNANLTAGPGPAATIGFAIATLLLAAGAALLVRVSRRAWLELLLITAALALAWAGTLRAANRFAALVGWCDLATALLAAWTLARLAVTPARRQLVLCVLVALLAVWTFQGLYQRTVEIPDTIRTYYENKAKDAATQSARPDDPMVSLFEGRMNSRLVTGFISFSNNVAAGLLPMLFLVAAMAMLLWQNRRAKAEMSPPPRESHPAPPPNHPAPAAGLPGDIPLPPLLLALLAALFVTGAVVLALTQSKGGNGVFFLGLPVLLLGLGFPAFFARHRRRLILSSLAALALLAAVTLAYGCVFHGLPTKTLLFRWHYWVASVPIIESHPALGVGLNNFSSYYSQYKLAVSPEDVKDPHNFLIRLAAEIGLPATALLLALLALALHAALRPRPSPSHSSFVIRHSSLDSPYPPFLPLLALGAAFCPAWWLLRLVLFENASDPNLFLLNSILSVLYMLCAWAGFLLAAGTLKILPPAALRSLALTALLSAAAMLLYDQVNMALVTGPVALLFWMLLAASSSSADAEPATPRRVLCFCIFLQKHASSARVTVTGATGPRSGGGSRTRAFVFRLSSFVFSPRVPWRRIFSRRHAGIAGAHAAAHPAAPDSLRPAPPRLIPRLALAAVLLTAALILFSQVLLPLTQDAFAWDPAPYARRALALHQQGRYAAALPELDAALARDSRNPHLLEERIALKAALGQSVRADVGRLLDISRTNFRLRIRLATQPSDLPPAQRIALLTEALWLSDQLPRDEIQRLSPTERHHAEAALRQLQSSATPPPRP